MMTDYPESSLRFALCRLSAAEVRAEGWLKEQAADDLREGLPGHLDRINNDVSRGMFTPPTAVFKPGEPSWWPGEQEGYWHEALVHLAFQVGDESVIQRVTDYVETVLDHQLDDGYIGVYAPEARLRPVDDPDYGGQGGELHTQAHIFLTLIAFYEHTGRTDVLAAVEKAAQLSMKTYADGVFGRTGERTKIAGGNSHAVTFADPMIQLYRLTGRDEYLEFVRTMVDDYNAHSPRDCDLVFTALSDPDRRFQGHGVHTAQSFHMVQAAALLDPELTPFAEKAAARMEQHLTPGGALVCGEMIDGKLGNGQHLYEYCAQAEFLKSLGFLVQYTPDSLSADRAARVFYNASQGARLHPLSALQYLSRDDRLDIPTCEAKTASNIRNEGSHFQMSSVIRPTCCPASAGRPLPYFLATSWMKTSDSLVAMNPAPSTVNTKISGAGVQIIEATDYPFSDHVVFEIKPDKEVSFNLVVRIPFGGTATILSAGGATKTLNGNEIVFSKVWKKGDRIELAFDFSVVLEQTADQTGFYYRRGALVYGLPFESDVKAVSENPRVDGSGPGGLFEYDIRAADKARWGLRIDPDAEFEPIMLNGDRLRPWNASPVGLRGTMLNAKDEPVPVTLVPMGASVSRRVTFLDSTASAEDAARLPEESEIGIGF